MKIRNFNDFDYINEGSQGGGNKFIFVRFGTRPDPKVARYFQEIALRNPKPTLMAMPGALVTMFETTLTKEALIQGFDRLGASYNLYQIVHTSAGGAGASLVARKPNKAQLKADLERAVAAEDWEKAAKLRDQIAAMEGAPAADAGTGTTESQVHTFESFVFEKEEVFVNGTNPEEFYKLVSELVDHELAELETEEEAGITKEACQKIKDYLVQNNFYVAPPEKPEGEELNQPTRNNETR